MQERENCYGAAWMSKGHIRDIQLVMTLYPSATCFGFAKMYLLKFCVIKSKWPVIIWLIIEQVISREMGVCSQWFSIFWRIYCYS